MGYRHTKHRSKSRKRRKKRPEGPQCPRCGNRDLARHDLKAVRCARCGHEWRAEIDERSGGRADVD